MKLITNTLLLFILTIINLSSAALLDATKWETTKKSTQSGNCQLKSNKLTVTVFPYYLTVEEEVEITASGSVYWGDPNTLEITGKFQLSPGSTMRSLLLWNGNMLLKAKLLDQETADSTMDAIVNKTITDPALIKYEGDNIYSYRIYPVAIGKSRKVRVLYTIPLQAKNELRMDIQPVFTLGCKFTPEKIPVKFIQGDSTDSKFIFSYGSIKKELQFGATYSIDFEHFYSGSSYIQTNSPKPLSILPIKMNKAFTYTIAENVGKGFYTSIFSTVPDTLDKLITQFLLSDYTVEAKIVTKNSSFIYDIPLNSSYNFYLKSDAEWDKNIYWNVYNKNGSSEIRYTENITTDSISNFNKSLPLLWASEKTFVDKTDNLGNIFGFVDNEMSLLALEKDTLSSANTLKYWNSGVPLLLPEEIYSDTVIVASSENINDNETTEIKSMTRDMLNLISLQIKPNNLVLINLNNLNLKNLSIEVYDLRGKLIHKFNSLTVKNNRVSIPLSSSLKGMFIMRIKSGSIQISRKLILK